MKVALSTLPATFACVAAVAGCGSSQAFEDPQSFIDAANAEGAGFDLGEPLSTNDPEHAVYALELSEEVHGGGSLTVTPSEDEARAEYDRCQSAASLLCYRAGNVALFLEDELPPEDRVRIDTAIAALGSD